MRSAAIAYALICAFMWVYQRHLLFVPIVGIDAPASYGLRNFSDIRLTAKDGAKLDAWYHPARPDYPTIVYFHGNGGNLSHRSPYFARLADAGFGILGLDYRGYGASQGSPSEEGLFQDARAALDYATGPLGLPPSRIVLYGESLGTGVAVRMAAEYPVAALVLQSPFSSAEAAAKNRYPWLPVHYLLRDRFDSLSRIAAVHAPLLLFHGERDAIVPIALGKQLFAAAREPKKAVYYPARGHNDLDQAQLTQAMLAFCHDQSVIPPG